MPPLQIPTTMTTTADAHAKWLKALKYAQELIDFDSELQAKAAKGFRLKERNVPAEVLGRIYGQYCLVLNQLYDTYLNNVQLQRAPYIMELISVILKRIFELRNEIVHFIVNDYIYVDGACIQNKLTPDQIQIVIPYHFPLECRTESSEKLLQKMWVDSVKRKTAPPVKEKKNPPKARCETLGSSIHNAIPEEPDSTSDEEYETESEPESIHTVTTEEYTQACVIQRHERFRQFFITNFKAKCVERRRYFADTVEKPSLELQIRAVKLIQSAYRTFMKLKRQHVLKTKRDMILGLIPDAWKRSLSYEEENNKIYDRRKRTRTKLQEIFLKELEKERVRLIFFRKDDQIDDITEEIREWFKEWYYGYGFFPEFPYDIEGGTVMVIRGDYNTIEEKQIADEKYLAATKGKTKEQLKQQELDEKANAEFKAEQEREKRKKDAEVLLKMRCNPFSDPGYQVKQSKEMQALIEAFQKYRASWSIFDRVPPENYPETVYGFLKQFMTEDLMSEIHADCRRHVDDLMRLELKLLIKMQQKMYKRVGWKYPRRQPRKRPKDPLIPKILNVDNALLKQFEPLFDLGVITKPMTKLKDVFGDSSYAAYDLNIADPNASFPLPGYGDIKLRLIYSCVFGIGINPGAIRNKSVLLLGPPQNGKSFLADAVAGELNAVKINISPEVFSARIARPAKLLAKVIAAAKVFQPTVIFLKNVERVLAKKVRPEDRKLKAQTLKKMLAKQIKTISNEDKIILIATCSDPWMAKARPLVSMFSEMILVPRADYGSVRQFFYERLQSIRSMPRDYNVQPLAQILQGYGFGFIVRLYESIMTPERIIRLNVDPLSPVEFLEPVLEDEIEPLTLEDYQLYVNFFLNNSSLKQERREYELINSYREVMYRKAAEREMKEEAAKENDKRGS